MKKKAKKNRTPSEQVRHLKKIKIASFGGMFLSIITPFAIMGIVNFNEYFVEYSGWRMTTASILALGVAGMAVWLATSKKVKDTFLVFLIGWFAIASIFLLMGKLVVDIAYIMLFGGIGIAGAYGIDLYGRKIDGEIKSIETGIVEAKKEATKEAYKEEVTEKEQEEKKKEVRW